MGKPTPGLCRASWVYSGELICVGYVKLYCPTSDSGLTHLFDGRTSRGRCSRMTAHSFSYDTLCHSRRNDRERTTSATVDFTSQCSTVLRFDGKLKHNFITTSPPL